MKAYMKAKPGPHGGTVYLYHVAYRDVGGDGPTFAYRVWAYNREHAEDKFFNAPDADGWEVVSIRKVVSIRQAV